MFSIEVWAILIGIPATVVTTAVVFWQIMDKKVDDKHADAVAHINLLRKEVHRMLENHEHRIQKVEDRI